MGLLTDPEKNPLLVKHLPKNYAKLSAISFLAGLLWLFCLLDENFNQRTYFSENALLPGLVASEYTVQEEQFAKDQHRTLVGLTKSSPSETPHAAIRESFLRLGLEVYEHHYNFSSSSDPSKVRQGRSTYAILRAHRASSLESIVFSVPYRPPSSGLTGTTGGIALMLSLAELFRYKPYLAKDLIFLVTENEYVGAKAWVEAYHGMKNSDSIQSSPLPDRGGAIQAAINLEIPGPDVGYMDLRIVGINGQLPNLDLVNLVKMSFLKDEVPLTLFNNTKLLKGKGRDAISNYLCDLATVARMVTVSAAGHLEGNHAFFQQFNIQSLTIRGVKGGKSKKIGFLKMAVALEGITRSVNNLLERFHQSFFFYVVTSTNRFVSIGLYMPPYGLVVLPIALTALALWTRCREEKEGDKSATVTASFSSVLPTFCVAHLIGLATFASQLLSLTFWSADPGALAAGTFVISLSAFWLVGRFYQTKDMELLKSLSLIEMIVGLYALSTLNFPLALLVTLFSAPIYCWFAVGQTGPLRFLHLLSLLMVHPLMIQAILIVLQSIATDQLDISLRSLQGLPHLLLDGLRRSSAEYAEYGNWLLPALYVFLLPLWIIQWVIACNSLHS